MAEIFQAAKTNLQHDALKSVTDSLVKAARDLARGASVTDVAADLAARTEKHIDRENGTIQPGSPLNGVAQLKALISTYGEVIATGCRIATGRAPSAEDKKFFITELEKISGLRLSSQGQFRDQSYSVNRGEALDAMKSEREDSLRKFAQNFGDKLSKALNDQQLLLGRSRDADFFVNSPDISRHQIAITPRESGYLIAKPSDASAPVYYRERGGQWQELSYLWCPPLL